MITENISGSEFQHQISTHSLNPGDRSTKSSFLTALNNAAQDYGKDKRPCEYFDLAGEDGLIHYKSATFVCDKERNRLTLGDCSDESKCIRVKLSKGGSLLVNRDSIDDLLMSIGMFSAKDQGLIMQAVMKDKIANAAKDKLDEGKDVSNLIEDIHQ